MCGLQTYLWLSLAYTWKSKPWKMCKEGKKSKDRTLKKNSISETIKGGRVCIRELENRTEEKEEMKGIWYHWSKGQKYLKLQKQSTVLSLGRSQ